MKLKVAIATELVVSCNGHVPHILLCNVLKGHDVSDQVVKDIRGLER